MYDKRQVYLNLMKKLVYFPVLLLLLLSAQYGSAKGISVEEARTVAEKFQTNGSILKSRRSLPLKHVYTESVKDMECVYVFARGTDNGYVVVAGDDLVQTPVLGYSDNGSFDTENMPENMKWWLGEYARQIEYLKSHPEAVPAKSSAKSADALKEVAPLMKSKWDQGSPYNIMCPELNWKRTYVGCVATATSQIMYYHKYPAVGTGTHSYQWKTGNRTITTDFSKYPFDWDNMLNTYTGNETEEQCNAVATLCYCAGAMADMDYSPTGSGTFTSLVPRALHKYFGYDDAMLVALRDYYTSEDWDNMIRSEIDAGRPVLYSGANVQIGHAFVLDGYTIGGYFHVNWGWGGTSDGYFRSTALDPVAQGAGGSNAGYNFGQTAGLGIRPETPETAHRYLVYQDGNFTTQTTRTSKGQRVKFEFDSRVTTESVKDKEVFNIGIGIFNDKNESVYEFYYEQPFEILAGNYYSGVYVSPVIPFTIPDGDYTVIPMFKTAEQSCQKVLSKPYRSGKVYMNVKGSSLTFSNQGPINIAVSRIDKKGSLNRGSCYSVSADFTNASRDLYSGTLTALFYDISNGNVYQVLDKFNVDLKKGETVNLKFSSELSFNSDKCVFAFVDNDYQLLYTEQVAVGEPLPEVEVRAALQDFPQDMALYSTTDVTFSLTNNSSAGFYGRISTVFAVNNQVKQFFSNDVYEIPAGQTRVITVHGMVNPNVVNQTAMFAVVDRDYRVLDSRDVNISFSNVPLLYVRNNPVLTGYSGYDYEADCVSFDKPEVNYTVGFQNLGADMNGELYVNLFHMMGEVPDLIASETVNLSAAYAQKVKVSYTFKDMVLENGEKYMCEMYYGDNMTPIDEENTRAYFTFNSASGVQAVDAAQVAVYPNPVEDVLNIASESPVASVEIYSMQGALVRAAEGVSVLNVSELRPATYIAVIVTENGKTTTQKIVKK